MPAGLPKSRRCLAPLPTAKPATKRYSVRPRWRYPFSRIAWKGWKDLGWTRPIPLMRLVSIGVGVGSGLQQVRAERPVQPPGPPAATQWRGKPGWRPRSAATDRSATTGSGMSDRTCLALRARRGASSVDSVGGEHGNLCAGAWGMAWGLVLAETHPLLGSRRP